MSVFPILDDVAATLRKWSVSLRQLDLTVNFGGVLKKDISIEPGTEIPIRHNLGTVPKAVLVLKQKGGVIDGGDTADTSEFVYLKNRASTTTAKADILILP